MGPIRTFYGLLEGDCVAFDPVTREACRYCTSEREAAGCRQLLGAVLEVGPQQRVDRVAVEHPGVAGCGVNGIDGQSVRRRHRAMLTFSQEPASAGAPRPRRLRLRRSLLLGQSAGPLRAGHHDPQDPAPPPICTCLPARRFSSTSQRRRRTGNHAGGNRSRRSWAPRTDVRRFPTRSCRRRYEIFLIACRT